MGVINKFYRLTTDVYGDGQEKNEKFFFKSAQEAEEFKNNYDSNHRNQDDEYIPTISSIYYDIEPVTFEEMIYEVSAKELSIMFNKKIVLHEDNISFE